MTPEPDTRTQEAPLADLRSKEARSKVQRGGDCWLLIVPAVLLGASCLFHVSVLMVSSADRSHAVVTDYYEKGLRWDEERARSTAERALGWRVEASLRADGNEKLELEVRVLRRDGQPLEESRVVAEMFHNARAGERIHRHLNEGGGAYRGSFPFSRRGLYELLVEVENGGKAFRSLQRLEWEPRRIVGEVP